MKKRLKMRLPAVHIDNCMPKYHIIPFPNRDSNLQSFCPLKDAFSALLLRYWQPQDFAF